MKVNNISKRIYFLGNKHSLQKNIYKKYKKTVTKMFQGYVSQYMDQRIPNNILCLMRLQLKQV